MLIAVRHLFPRRVIPLAVVFVLFVGPWAQAQDRNGPATGEAYFTVFVDGRPVGVERTAVSATADGWQVDSSGRFFRPVDLDNRSFRVEYDAGWQPRRLALDAVRFGEAFTINTTFIDGLATSVVQIGPERSSIPTVVDPETVALPDYVFGAYEAMAARLSGAESGDQFQVYQVPEGTATALVRETLTQRVQTSDEELTARIFRLTLHNPDTSLDLEIWIDPSGRLLRVAIPALAVEAARDDIVRVSTRLSSWGHPGDAAIRVPTSGFSLAATVTTPVDQPMPPRGWPAVLLVPGTSSTDRDEVMFGVPLFAQIAGALADRGYLVMRYDKRGVGQSGGRQESAALEDYADDVRTLVRHLGRRDDVDDDRLVVLGHGEGGWVGLYAASRERRIRGLGLLAVPAVTGVDLVLEQQEAELDRMQAPAAEREAMIALQAKIHAAVLGEEPWDDVPEDVRRRADTLWFRSFLEFDPAEVMRRTSQPVLIVHGDLDRQMPPHHADRMTELAQVRQHRDATVDVARLPGVNHLLLGATTGEIEEYGRLEDRTIAPAAISALVDWLADAVPPEDG